VDLNNVQSHAAGFVAIARWQPECESRGRARYGRMFYIISADRSRIWGELVGRI